METKAVFKLGKGEDFRDGDRAKSGLVEVRVSGSD